MRSIFFVFVFSAFRKLKRSPNSSEMLQMERERLPMNLRTKLVLLVSEENGSVFVHSILGIKGPVGTMNVTAKHQGRAMLVVATIAFFSTLML